MAVFLWLVAVVLGAPATAAGAPAAGPAGSGPVDVLWFDLDAAVKASKLDYDEQLLAFVLQVSLSATVSPVCVEQVGRRA